MAANGNQFNFCLATNKKRFGVKCALRKQNSEQVYLLCLLLPLLLTLLYLIHEGIDGLRRQYLAQINFTKLKKQSGGKQLQIRSEPHD